MPEVKWTDEQLQAIKTKNCNLLVSAGAGSGKTAVLVARIIDTIINYNVDIDKLLIVTFTNAAASEMRERIAESLYNELNNKPEIQRQIMLLNKSSITTIHSFCLEVIREYFYKLDLDPNFRVGDETEQVLLKSETLDELFEEEFEEDDENFAKLINFYSEKNGDNQLKNLILKVYEFIQSTPYPKEWLNDKCNMYKLIENNDFGKTIWGSILLSYAKQEIDGNIADLKSLEEELLNYEDVENYIFTIKDDILNLEALNKCDTWDGFYNSIFEFEFLKLKQARKASEGISELVKNTRKKVKENIKEYLKDTIFVSNSSSIYEDMKYAYQYINLISETVLKFNDKYQIKKREKNIIDFNDIEHLCLKLLNDNKEIREHYKEKFEEILIDEYQDSNLIQETILNTISKGKTFMVGDVKQSIYRFRQARPELFLEKYYKYNKINSNNESNYKILLSKNFRSNINVINCVNDTFRQLMSKDIGELDYNQDEYLKFAAGYYTTIPSDTELHIIENQPNNSDINENNVEQFDDKPQIEARVVANRIQDLIKNSEVYDKKNNCSKKVEYKDIVILMRATSGYIDGFIKELSINNIPAYADSNSGYFENAEIQIITSLLKIIDNPFQDVPLLTVLRSQIGGFDVDELIQIRLIDKKCDYYSAMQKAAGQGIEGISIKVNSFLNKLDNWREKARYLSISKLLWELYIETGYYYYVSLLPDGNVRKANLDLLLERTQSFEKTSYKGLFNFLKFIDNLRDSSGDYGSSKTIGENENVVRIMSIHKSKGLEFPIVFLCGTGRRFNNRDLSDDVILHQDLGFGVDIIKPEKRIIYPCITKHAIKQKMKLELLSEEMRILYVAMTRAKEKLIITGMSSDIFKFQNKMIGEINKYSIFKAQSYLEWLYQASQNSEKKWQYKFWKFNDVLSLTSEELLNNYKKLLENLNGSIEVKCKDVNDKLAWIYPHMDATLLPTKISVTELKRLNDISESNNYQVVPTIEKPEFMSTEKKSGIEYGTELHNLMQRIDFNLSIENIVEKYKIIDASFIQKIKEFLCSNICNRIVKSTKVYREIPFNLNIPASEVYNNKGLHNEDVMMQGIIDLFFIENNEVVLLDYKTDNINNIEELANKYNTQMKYYKIAIESITGLKVKEVYIYSFKAGCEVLLDI